MRHSGVVATATGIPTVTVSATLKCWRIRNSATRSLGSVASTGRMASFHASVSGSSSRMNHLRAGEEFTPDTQHANSDRQTEDYGVRHHVAQLIVDRQIIRMAEAHQ